MSRVCQRLHEEATAVDCEIQELQESCRVGSAAEPAAVERRLDGLAVKRASLAKAIILLSGVENAVFGDKQRAFVGRRPAHLAASGSVAVEGRVDGRRIVVSLVEMLQALKRRAR